MAVSLRVTKTLTQLTSPTRYGLTVPSGDQAYSPDYHPYRAALPAIEGY